ncbi:invasion associated locus B family protein [Paracoccus sp. CPCC 101403]|uniref:Invasion associated locus B family protein n=1 Tax=Paracoccus broussonetiae TaxID=3075834 RepID=A0ABU3EHQ3_9RHOB|nr:invasion associated locus B family protein [Paracoccus sp. CPCC 101403]MDT1063778.1 invasion associated locus B family protein [Paracoccus sp. CPCC 101403]
MANRTSAALLAAIFAIAGTAGGAMAQTAESPAPATAPAAEATAPAAATAEAPAAAAPAAAPATGPGGTVPEGTTPQVGQTYAKSTHGDWLLRCMKTESGQDPCELYQLLKDEHGSAVAEASILPMSGEVQAVVTFVAPLETDLQAGLGLQIDSGKAARYPFMLCAPVGCISRIGMTDAELAPMKRGSSATVSLLPFGAKKDQLVKLSLSLKGFTSGFDALVAANKDVPGGIPAPNGAPTPVPAPADPAAAPAPAPKP